MLKMCDWKMRDRNYWHQTAKGAKCRTRKCMRTKLMITAMNSCVEAGVLRGQPFGGVMTLVSNRLQSCTEVITATDRYVIVLFGDLVIINVYLPCVGTNDGYVSLMSL